MYSFQYISYVFSNLQKQTSPLNPKTCIVSMKNKKKPNNGNIVRNVLNLAAYPLFIFDPITIKSNRTELTNSNIIDAI